MKIYLRLIVLLLVITTHVVVGSSSSSPPQEQGPQEQGPPVQVTYEANWKSINSRPLPSWYDQSKFGIFVHWGIYSVPAFAVPGVTLGEWYWLNLKTESDGGETQAFHNKSYGPNFSYKEFAPLFKAHHYNPDRWAELFAKSGAKYVVLTTKHHDGFCNWQSKYSDGWNSVDQGPHLDIVGTLSKSVRNAGLHMGLYHSLYQWFAQIYADDWASGRTPTRDHYISTVLHPMMKEMVNTYEPDVVWVDGDWEETSTYWRATEFLQWLYTNTTVKDRVVTNDRWGSDCRGKNGGYWTPYDGYHPGKLLSHKWENCYTIGSSWGYNLNEDVRNFKSTNSLIRTLVSTVSCGGNLLLNVGPNAEGVIPMLMQERLVGIGQWLNVNGEAIYNTTWWRAQNDTEDKNLWYTTNAATGAVYAMSFVWPDSYNLVLTQPALTQNTTIALLGYNGALAFKSAATDKGIEIKLPTLGPNSFPPHGVYTFKLLNVT
ncbi:hypothetical protein SAMD00019534_004620, partial [Acytostelium subglobosum LB1]|uniref:hypothetical protein n=1 Tax=Acytostelium subglobosum LB1 TaxID=1410327 RepID=UPI000644E71A